MARRRHASATSRWEWVDGSHATTRSTTLLDRRARPLDRRRHRGALPGPGRRAHALRHEPDPPERARARRPAAGARRRRERVGVASTNRLDEDGIRERRRSAPRPSPTRSAPNPRAAILPEPDGRTCDPELGFVAATAEAGAERRAEGARAVIAAGEASRAADRRARSRPPTMTIGGRELARGSRRSTGRRGPRC